MKLALYAFLCGAFLAVANSASAQSLAEKKEVREAEAVTEDEVKSTNSACGISAKLSVDWASFKGKYDDSHTIHSAASWCADALSGVRSVCESGADEKAAVSKKVKAVKCSFDKAATSNAPIKSQMQGSTLVIGYNWTSANLSSETKKALMNLL